MTNKKSKNKKKNITRNTAEFKPIIPNLFGNGQDYVISGNNKSITVTTTNQAIKHDQDKPDLDMIPPEFEDMMAKAFMDGMIKYGRANYRQNGGLEWSRLLSAARRHINAFSSGEDFAEDSKVHHLGHAGACLAMLADYYVNKLGTDNRRGK